MYLLNIIFLVVLQVWIIHTYKYKILILYIWACKYGNEGSVAHFGSIFHIWYMFLSLHSHGRSLWWLSLPSPRYKHYLCAYILFFSFYHVLFLSYVYFSLVFAAAHCCAGSAPLEWRLLYWVHGDDGDLLDGGTGYKMIREKQQQICSSLLHELLYK